jgi:hypothetical protein
VEVDGCYKHSSLLQYGNNYDCKNIYSKGSRCGSTGVEHSTINPEIIGSNPAPADIGQNIGENFFKKLLE